MDSNAIVERMVRDGWVAGDASVLAETISSEGVRGIFSLFATAFDDVELLEFGPIFSDSDGAMVACYGVMHIRQVAEFLHVNAVGKQADAGFTAMFAVESEQITRMWVEVDFAALYQA